VSNDGRPVRRASLAEISAIPPLLAGLDESVFATPPEAAPTPVPTPAAPHSPEHRFKNLQVTQPNGPGESRKVAGVVDAMDGGKSAAVPLDLVNAGGTEI
jgi:hypothetical protein